MTLIDLEPEDMPCCPLCDNVILDWQAATIVNCGGAKCLVHTDCTNGDDDEA